MNNADTPTTMDSNCANRRAAVSSVHQRELAEQAQMSEATLFETKERLSYLVRPGSGGHLLV